MENENSDYVCLEYEINKSSVSSISSTSDFSNLCKLVTFPRPFKALKFSLEGTTVFEVQPIQFEICKYPNYP